MWVDMISIDLIATKIQFYYLQNLNNFLAQPNALEYLDISSTDTTLESVSQCTFNYIKIRSLMFDRLRSYSVRFLEVVLRIYRT